MGLANRTGVRSTNVRFVVFYLILGIALLFFLIHYVIVPWNLAFLEKFSVTVLAITVEAIPFLLIGSVLSAIIHLYVSEEIISRIIPRNRVGGVLIASVLGSALPVCDCATVPIVKRLIAKGVPLNVAVTFMLATPIINPLVVFSTWFAFYQYPKFIFYRLAFGLVVAIGIGFIVSFLDGDRQLKLVEDWESKHQHEHEHHHEKRHGAMGHMVSILEHAGEDFYDVGRFFMVGVVLSAIVQAIIPNGSLYAVGHSQILSLVVMIAAAYLLSVCSQADAFIARAFMNQFTAGALISFLIFGPMIDLKNTLMLSTIFRARFILILIALVATASLGIGYLIDANGL